MNQTGKKIITHSIGNTRIIGFLALMCLSFTAIAQDTLNVRTPQAQQRRNRETITMTDTLQLDSTIKTTTFVVPSEKAIRQFVEKQFFVPDPKKALWLAIAIPGGGQIYNRKYWKLPLIYGGFVGCVYALNWNNMMYHDYSKAYIDITDDDPNTKSYESFLHLGRVINENNPDELKTWQNKFKKRKDYYRRYRDMSVFILIGVYALSVIDAYVDASLSEFDISDDITLKVEPAIMNDRSSANLLKSSALGLQCSISF